MSLKVSGYQEFFFCKIALIYTRYFFYPTYILRPPDLWYSGLIFSLCNILLRRRQNSRIFVGAFGQLFFINFFILVSISLNIPIWRVSPFVWKDPFNLLTKESSVLIQPNGSHGTNQHIAFDIDNFTFTLSVRKTRKNVFF